MEETIKKKKKWNDDTFITEWVKKFDKDKYETSMCVVAVLMFLVPAIKLTVALAADFWMERLWVQITQILGVAGILLMVLYVANVYENTLKNFGGAIKQVVKNHKWFFLTLTFIVWMFLSFFVNGRHLQLDWFYYSLFGTLNRNEGIFTRAMQMMLLVGLALVKNPKKKERVVQVVLAESVYLAIPLLAQHWSGIAKLFGLSKNEAFVYMSEYGLHCSIFQHVNHYGYYLCMAVMLSVGMLYQAKQVKGMMLYGIAFVINLTALVINNTFGSWLASLISLVALIVLFVAVKGRKVLVKGLILLAAFVVISSAVPTDTTSVWGQVGGLTSDVKDVASDSENADEAGSGRWKVWKIAAKNIVEKPVFGGCEDCLIYAYLEEGYLTLNRPANEYLQYAAFYGIPALLMYVGILIWIFIKKLKNIHKLPDIVLVLGGAVIAYAISACFGNTTLYTTWDFFVLLGLLACEGEWKIESEADEL